MICFLFKLLCSARGVERFQKAERVSGRLLQMISLVRLPSVCRHQHWHADRFGSQPTPAEHPSRRDATVNAVPPSSGTRVSLAKQALTVSDHSNGQVLLLPFVRQHSSSNHNLAQHCSRVYCQVHSISTCVDFGPKVERMVRYEALLLQVWNGFSLPHRPTPHAGSGLGHPSAWPSQTFHRLNLLVRIGIGIVKV